MSQALSNSEKLALGGTLRHLEAVLHTVWQIKVDLQTCTKSPAIMTSAPELKLFLVLQTMLWCQIVRGGHWGSVLVGGPIGTDVGAEGHPPACPC
eukprot:scaffold11592_cov14-Tisochrysis_lutea.AAC.1